MNLDQKLHHQRLLDRARRRAAAGHHEDAIRLVRLLLRRDPANLDARLCVARILLDAGEAGPALSELDVADWYRQAGEAKLSRGAQTRHLMLRAKAMRRLGRAADARRVLESVLQLKPAHRGAALLLADLYIELNESDRALPLLENLADRYCNDRRVLRRLVDLYEAAGRFDRALACLNYLDASQDGSGGYELRRMRLLRHAGRYIDAIDVGEQLAAQSNDPVVHQELADIAAHLGDAPRATRHLAAIPTGDRSADHTITRARFHMRAGRFAQAGRLWWKLTRQSTGQTYAEANLAVCATVEHRTRLAARVIHTLRQRLDETELRRVMAGAWSDATPGRLWHRVGNRLDQDQPNGVLSGLMREAAGVFESRLAHHRTHADVHYHLAVCHEASGLRGAAAESLHRALDINPGYIDAARLRTRMLIEDGNLTAAKALCRATRQRKTDTDQLLDLELAIDVLRGQGARANRRLVDAQLSDETRTHVLQNVSNLLDTLDHAAASRWCQPDEPLSNDRAAAVAA